MDLNGLTRKEWITLCFRTKSQCLFVPETRCAPRNGDRLCSKCEERDFLLFEKLQYLQEDWSTGGRLN